MIKLKNRLKGRFGKQQQIESIPAQQGPIAAGLAVVADDTGRVLMIQRPLKDGDPNAGKWEFPGGKIEGRELSVQAALREWQEEVGLEPPTPEEAPRRWDSIDGKYAGFVVRVPSESMLDLNARDLFADPDSEVGGVVAWVHPRDLPNHNLRPEMLSDVDEVMAKVTKWLLTRSVRKSVPVNRLKSRLSAGMSAADFDPTNLAEGAKVEMEHTDDLAEAERIAMDHLTEDPDYYAKLRQIEAKGLTDSVQAAGRWLAEKWEQLESRYGRKAALAMAVGMLATLPVPGNVAAVIGIAEGIRGVHGYFTQEYGGDVTKLKSFCPTGEGGGVDPSCDGESSTDPKPTQKPTSKPGKLKRPPPRSPAEMDVVRRLSALVRDPQRDPEVEAKVRAEYYGHVQQRLSGAVMEAVARPSYSSQEDAVQAFEKLKPGEYVTDSKGRIGYVRRLTKPGTVMDMENAVNWIDTDDTETLSVLRQDDDIKDLRPLGLSETAKKSLSTGVRRSVQKGDTVMDVDPALQLRFPVNRLTRKGKGSYFEECERDDEGHCLPSGEVGGGKKPAKKAAPGSQLPAKTLAKLKELGADKLPPADVPASEIKVSLDAGDSGALLTWKQKSRSGRVSQQSAYTAAFHARNAAEKWDRVQRVEPVLKDIEKGLTERMQDKSLSQRQREAAAITSCIRETGLRPTDSAESVKHGHFGISSLQGQHVKVKGDEVHLDFIGKEGVRNRTVIRDPVNVAFIKNAMKNTRPKDFLFKEANSGDAIKTLKEVSRDVGGPEDILVKDLRTVNATRWGEAAVNSYKGPPPPLSGDPKKDSKAIAKAILAMSGEVSKKLNNNPERARDNYIHPRVFQRWLSTLSSRS